MSAKINRLVYLFLLNFINMFNDFVNNNNEYSCSSLSAILVQVHLDYFKSTWTAIVSPRTLGLVLVRIEHNFILTGDVYLPICIL